MTPSRTYLIPLLCALLLAWFGAVPSAIAGQPVVPEGEVARVVVEGTRRIDEAAVLAEKVPCPTLTSRCCSPASSLLLCLSF